MENGVFIIIAFILGWLVAQLTKVILALVERGKLSGKEFLALIMKSGGMPSSHTACLTAATLMIGLMQGFTSPLFAFAVCMDAIVIYDALNVRYAVGEQGKFLNALAAVAKKGRKKKSEQQAVKVIEGHKVPEVLVGLLMGLIACFIATMILAALGWPM
ncbi:divergent PAP2 family protein [Candidatus Saccharibacteria bacterium]|nr:divergent PAP2 family protein [Candidatus Saccharibacteria bacterium]